jgi:hypothetical protein
MVRRESAQSVSPVEEGTANEREAGQQDHKIGAPSTSYRLRFRTRERDNEQGGG